MCTRGLNFHNGGPSGEFNMTTGFILVGEKVLGSCSSLLNFITDTWVVTSSFLPND